MNRSVSDHRYTATRRERTLDVSFDDFERAFETLLGVMDESALRAIANDTPEGARKTLEAFVGPSGFAVFQKIDHGGLLTAFTGRTVRATTYVFGNALIAMEMTKHVERVGLYVPLRLYLIESGPGRVDVTYDLPSATMAQFGSSDVDAVAAMLDAKIEKVLDDAVAQAKRTEAA